MISGKSRQWIVSLLMKSIKEDALLQKTFTVDFLEKNKKERGRSSSVLCRE